MRYWTTIFLLVAASALPFAVEGGVTDTTSAEPARLVFAVFASMGALLIVKRICDTFRA